VVPTDAAARPTCARSAVTTVPNPGAAAEEPSEAAVGIEATVNPKVKITAAVIRERSRNRAIASPRGLNARILTPVFGVNV
jgi:hypothetical protein